MTHNNDPLAGVPAVEHSDRLSLWTQQYHAEVDPQNLLLEHIQWERQQRAAVEADAAAMRDCLSWLLGCEWLARAAFVQSGVTDWDSVVLDRLQSALSGEAGAALLAECDELAARVERLRAVVRVGVGNASVDEIKQAMALEPGDLEG